MSNETLYDCPECGGKNFTARGLTAHACAKRQAKALAVVTTPAVNDAEMGAQLTTQYHRAVNAMPEILRFGAMMIRLREHLSGSNAHVGHKALPKGVNAHDGGVKAWLEKHAPEVKRTTAQRFEDVTLSVAQDYAQLVGAKVAKQYALPELVSADPAKLPPAIAKKQQALFDHVSGTSQKSWLDKFRPAKERGGNRHTGAKRATRPLSAEEITEALRALCASAGEAVTLAMKEDAHTALDVEAELDGLHHILEDAAERVGAWKKLTKTERKARLGEAIAKKLSA